MAYIFGIFGAGGHAHKGLATNPKAQLLVVAKGRGNRAFAIGGDGCGAGFDVTGGSQCVAGVGWKHRSCQPVMGVIGHGLIIVGYSDHAQDWFENFIHGFGMFADHFVNGGKQEMSV
jgi:hypothetical protein